MVSCHWVFQIDFTYCNGGCPAEADHKVGTFGVLSENQTQFPRRIRLKIRQGKCSFWKSDSIPSENQAKDKVIVLSRK
jgi:hypothetical protein